MVTDDPATTAAYCAIDPRHTMCLYQGPSEECKKKTIARGMSEAVKAAMVAKHNELRRKVAQGNQPDQPPAANMRQLVWDEELATSAQRWADQCTNSHDYAKQTLDGVYVGQNLYMTWGPSEKNRKELDDDSVGTIQNWFDEVEDFKRENINPFKDIPSPVTGHYTQVVWANTAKVGCGNVYFRDEEAQPNFPFHNYIVCNYGPGGNFIDGSMYIEGTACESCPSSTTCVDSLCQTV